MGSQRVRHYWSGFLCPPPRALPHPTLLQGRGQGVVASDTLTLPLTCWMTWGGLLALSGLQSWASPWKLPTSTVFWGISFHAHLYGPFFPCAGGLLCLSWWEGAGLTCLSPASLPPACCVSELTQQKTALGPLPCLWPPQTWDVPGLTLASESQAPCEPARKAWGLALSPLFQFGSITLPGSSGILPFSEPKLPTHFCHPAAPWVPEDTSCLFWGWAHIIVLPWTQCWAGGDPPSWDHLGGGHCSFSEDQSPLPLLSIPGLWLGVAVGIPRTSQHLRSPQLGVNSTLPWFRWVRNDGNWDSTQGPRLDGLIQGHHWSYLSCDQTRLFQYPPPSSWRGTSWLITQVWLPLPNPGKLIFNYQEICCE